MYARGVLFGKMKYELGDHSFVRCPESGLSADIEFKTKGYFGGTYDAIGGYIKDTQTGENLYELSGLWSREMYIKDLTVSLPHRLSCLILELLANYPPDWKEGTALRCNSCEGDATYHTTTRRASRARVTEVVEQSDSCNQGEGPRHCYRREIKN